MPASTLLNKRMIYQMIMKWKAVPNMKATTITEMAVLRISGWGNCRTRALRIYFKINSDNKITTFRQIFFTKIIMTPITSVQITSRRKSFWKVLRKPAIRWCARAGNPTQRHLPMLMVIQSIWMQLASHLEIMWMQLSLKLSTGLRPCFQTLCEEKSSWKTQWTITTTLIMSSSKTKNPSHPKKGPLERVFSRNSSQSICPHSSVSMECDDGHLLWVEHRKHAACTYIIIE